MPPPTTQPTSLEIAGTDRAANLYGRAHEGGAAGAVEQGPVPREADAAAQRVKPVLFGLARRGRVERSNIERAAACIGPGEWFSTRNTQLLT
jgi:hypothetical protein